MPSVENQIDRQNHTIISDDETIDFKQIINQTVNNWYLFVIAVTLCFIASWFYAYYSSPNWNVSSRMLVEDSKSGSSLLGGSNLGSEFGSAFSMKSSADNEVQLLKSRSLIESTVEELQLNVRIYNVVGFKKNEIYQESPFSITLHYTVDTLRFQNYSIEFKDNGQYTIANSKENLHVNTKVGEVVKLNQYDLKLNAIPNHRLVGKYLISIESIDAATGALSLNFTAALTNKQSTTIDLGLTYPHPRKGEVILDKLMELYLLYNLQNKVKTADNTIAFIDSRILLVRSELNNIEQQFEQYKTQNNIADISTQSKVLVSSVSDYNDRLNQQETQLRIVNELEKILNNPQNKDLIPTSIVAPNDISFGQSISAYNNLLLERDRAGLAYTTSNPIIQNYDQQIETARQTLLRSVAAYKRSLETLNSEAKKQNSTIDNKLQEIPAKERGYLDFQRQQTLKQDLYLYLLQKKEETAISKTSTISSSRIIDHAKSEFSPYKPKKSIIYMIGLALGLIIPAIYLLIKELFNVRINSKQDVLKGTSTPIVGEIGHNTTQDSLVVINNSRTIISEQFRSVRTKLNYILNSSTSNVILFTSSMGGEGKSFLSINLGSALALTGKTVVFMELDLRKPKLSEIMGQDHNEYGYSNYVVSDFKDTHKLIKPVWFDENCSVVSSGPIPPNPTELLNSKKLPVLIDELKSKFDYVIIDCAPIGLVTDALIIEKYADITFYVIRERATYKSQLNIINDLKQNNEVKSLYIILNDIKTKQSGYSAYGYGIEKKKKWNISLKLSKK